jgi:hypothetical protein
MEPSASSCPGKRSRNGLRGSLGWGSVLDRTAIPNCNLYNLEGLPASASGFLMTTASVDQQSRIHSFRYKIGKLSERKRGRLLPKRHQIKHLEFIVSWFGTRGSEVQILSPRPNYLTSITYRRKRYSLSAYFSGSSVHFPRQLLFIINNLEATLNPWVKTRGSGVRVRYVFIEGEHLRQLLLDACGALYVPTKS